MEELETLKGLNDAHRGAGFLCQAGNAEQGHAIGVLSNLSLVLQVTPQEVATVAASERRGIGFYLS